MVSLNRESEIVVKMLIDSFNLDMGIWSSFIIFVLRMTEAINKMFHLILVCADLDSMIITFVQFRLFLIFV